MKNSRKIKKRFLALLGCAALGAVLAPAALARETEFFPDFPATLSASICL